MKKFKKFLALFLTLALIVIPVNPALASLVPSEGADLTGYTVILHTNDSHGRAVPDSYNAYMGFTAVSALKKSYEKAGAEVILLDAGDSLHGLPFANMVQGKSIVELMNLAGYDAMTPGNHDFNYGTNTLLITKDMMDFPLLSSNITNKSDGSDFLEDHITIDKNGVTYGIFGLSTPETAYKTNPNNVTAIEFTDPVAAATEEVKELKAEGADVIIALSHLGTDLSSVVTSTSVATQVDGIDLVVDGHSHSTYDTGLTVGDTLIVSTGQYIQNIGVVMIDSTGKMEADLVNATEFTGTDAAIDELAATYTSSQDELLSEVIGYSTVDLDGIREHVRAFETNMGDLATDAFRWATDADVAITNGGGIRASIEIGDITKKSIVTVFPFGNYVVTKNVTGEALLLALEHGASTYPEPLGAFLQVSGITFTIDATKEAGSRIKNAKINGVALDPKASYLLATNDFIIAGGDGYTMLADFAIANEFGSMEDVLYDYLEVKGDVTEPKGGRITIIEPTTSVTDPVTEEPAVVVEEPAFELYVVVKGDCLSMISQSILGKASEWKLIYEWNKDTIKDPDMIFIGQKLKINKD
ncbi:MAG: 5'-nucleotidase C-terminal domain-containing protein [Mobilitalea sp.]